MKNKAYLIIKRLFDIFGSLIGCLFLIPITILVKIIYIFTGDFHTIFYSQDRIGKNGKIFRLYKYRTMVKNADLKLEEILKSDSKEAKEYRMMKKISDDPRITKAGKIIRKISIDELPQVINILFNQMSFIGNRPYLPREKKEMGKYYDIIVSTKPGLTGYWQVMLRSKGTFNERLKMEKYYSEHMSLILDVKIFFRTIKVVFRCKGAK